MKRLFILGLAVFLSGFIFPKEARAYTYTNFYYPGFHYSAYNQHFQAPNYNYPSYNYRYNSYPHTYNFGSYYQPGNHPLNHFTYLNRFCYGCGQVYGNPYYTSVSPFGYYFQQAGYPYSSSQVRHFGSPGTTPYRSSTTPFQKAYASQ